MPLDISFTETQMKTLIEGSGINVVVFKPRFKPNGYLANLEAFPGRHNKTTNEISFVCVPNPPLVTSRGPRKKRRKFITAWDGLKLLSTQAACNGILGTTNENASNFAYSEADNQSRLVHIGDPDIQINGPFVAFELVVFTVEQVMQVFKTTEPLTPSSNTIKADKFTLRQMAIDMGIVVGTSENRCRKCINLYAVGGSTQPIAAATLGNSLSLQIGQPCPPDWWYNQVLMNAIR